MVNWCNGDVSSPTGKSTVRTRRLLSSPNLKFLDCPNLFCESEEFPGFTKELFVFKLDDELPEEQMVPRVFRSNMPHQFQRYISSTKEVPVSRCRPCVVPVQAGTGDLRRLRNLPSPNHLGCAVQGFGMNRGQSIASRTAV